jgi:hypothetical protein
VRGDARRERRAALREQWDLSDRQPFVFVRLQVRERPDATRKLSIAWRDEVATIVGVLFP